MDYVPLQTAVTNFEEMVDWERKNEIADADLAQTQNLVRLMSRLSKFSKLLALLSKEYASCALGYI